MAMTGRKGGALKSKISFHAAIRWFVLLLGTVSAVAQTNSYRQTNLVSDMAGAAAHTDPRLVNPWGIAFVPGQPFWVADNNSGFATVYDANGISQFSVQIPASGAASPGTPTGTAASQTGGFILRDAPSQFLFATEDGTISGWNGTGNAILAVDHSARGAVYKGLAILSPGCCATYLVVANFQSGLIEPYTQAFVPLAPPGSFTDPELPVGYAPFNIQQVGTQVFVTYAVQDAAKHDPVNGAGNGIVDIFDLEGNFVKRFASNGPLNSPWGIVQASASFGQCVPGVPDIGRLSAVGCMRRFASVSLLLATLLFASARKIKPESMTDAPCSISCRFYSLYVFGRCWAFLTFEVSDMCVS
jgi:uncharacterized protein (TIGR03118 family)